MEQSQDKPIFALKATRALFKPIARLLLANGITLPAILETLKQVLVETAIEDFPVKGKVTTDSRISILTGVHRKDVKRIRSMPMDENGVPPAVSLGNQVVNTWMTERRWLDKQKKPLALPRLPFKKGMKSFEGLVESISKDIRSRAVLDELERAGIVRVEDDYVYLQQEAFIPHKDFEEQLYFLSRGNAAHLDAAVTNVQSDKAEFFDRMVYYDNIPAEAIPALTASASDNAMHWLKQVNLECKKQNRKKLSDRQQLTIGVYIHHQKKPESVD